MKQLHVSEIIVAVENALLDANFKLPSDVLSALEDAHIRETSSLGKNVLQMLLDNAQIAADERLALCQDTGMVICFLEIGQDLYIQGDLYQAIHEGVRNAYKNGYLRQSVVLDPIFNRKNTGDNTPAIIYADIVPGFNLKITVCPKGFGCENMSRSKMLIPSDGIEAVEEFIVETVKIAGPNTCPPSIVGVGIGGTIDKACLLSKKALIRPLNQPHKNPEYRELEERLTKQINALGIGPAGFGGDITTLGVQIESYPTHIASIPVCVTMSCHALRHKTLYLEGV